MWPTYHLTVDERVCRVANALRIAAGLSTVGIDARSSTTDCRLDMTAYATVRAWARSTRVEIDVSLVEFQGALDDLARRVADAERGGWKDLAAAVEEALGAD
jgi:hypothetical protein